MCGGSHRSVRAMSPSAKVTDATAMGPNYLIPQGCIVRNTFLEWCEADSDGTLQRMIPLEFATSPRRRGESCPAGMRLSSKTSDTCQQRLFPCIEDVESTACGEDQDHCGEDQDQQLSDGYPLSDDTRNAVKAQQNRSSARRQWGKDAVTGSYLVLRGLPFSANERELGKFIEAAGVGGLSPGQPIVLLPNAQGRPSGFAEIHFADAEELKKARETLHMRKMGTRYVEVLPWRPTASKWPKSTMHTRHERHERQGAARWGRTMTY
mmetsp:Transcript_11612/g.32876  ORF Transcript_11612/g.32876 Transcript_11612/m.32876 type:complete len:265 (-) Transcript_11612:58-852(-)